MDHLVLQENLKEGLLVTERISSKSPSLPILGNVFIDAHQNSIELNATDLEMGIRYKILAKGKTEGQAVVSPGALSQFLSALPGLNIALRTQDHNLRVETGEFSALFRALDPEDFPIIPTPKGSEEFLDIETPTLCQGLASVVNFVGQTQARPEISGVLFLFQGDTLKLVSTDSFRLAEKTLFLKTGSVQERSFIVPQKAARELISIFGERKGKTRIFFSPTQIFFDYTLEGEPQEPKIQMVSRLIEGEYPRYQDVIPTATATCAIVDREVFLNHVKASSVFAGKTNDVHVIFDPAVKQLRLSSKSVDLGENISSFSGEVTGERTEISFNWRFLSDGLSQMKSEKVEFCATTEDGPAILKPLEGEGYVYVVMPIKA